MTHEPPNRNASIAAITAVAVAALLLAGAVGIGAAAQEPKTDTTNTSLVTDINNTTTLEHNPVGNDTYNLAVNTTSNTSNKKAEFEKEDWSTEITSGWSYNGSDTEHSTDYYFWNLEVSEEDLRKMPVTADETEHVDITVYNNTTMSNESDMEQLDINQSVNVTSDRTVLYISTDDDSLTISSQDPLTRFGSYDIAEVSSDDVGVAGDNTTVDVVFGNGSSADALEASNAPSIYSSLWTAYEDPTGLDDGTTIYTSQLQVDGTHRPIYSGDENSEAVATNGVADFDSDILSVNLAESEFSDADSIDVTVNAGDPYGANELFSAFGIDAFRGGVTSE